MNREWDTQLLKDLPHQQQLVASSVEVFACHEDVLAGVLVGSLACGTGDRVSDADILFFTRNGFHRQTASSFAAFEAGKAIFYRLIGEHNDKACFRKYLFEDLTSAEIHCADVAEAISLSQPCVVLFDKAGVVNSKLTDDPAPQHATFPVYPYGDEGLMWELLTCMKWLSRGEANAAKQYLKKLAAVLPELEGQEESHDDS